MENLYNNEQLKWEDETKLLYTKEKQEGISDTSRRELINENQEKISLKSQKKLIESNYLFRRLIFERSKIRHLECCLAIDRLIY